MKSSLYGFACTAWKGIRHSSIRVTKSDFVLTRFRVQYFSARRVPSSCLPKLSPQPPIEEESDAFYVVRKGDIIGIYKSLSDCQTQVSSSVCDPSVSVYKGYSLCKETEEYLASRGLKNAMYSLNAVDAKADLFETLVPCPFKQPDGPSSFVDQSPKESATQKRSAKMEPDEAVFLDDKSPKSNSLMIYILEFDGASKGNPGKAGAGAILRTEDGSVVCRLREGLGAVSNNVAEYRALIMGMRYALKKGYQRIRVQGDSRLICMQVNDVWKTKNQNMTDLCKEVKGLRKKFVSFKISHVKRAFNSDADAQANLAVDLPTGQVYECDETC